MLLVSGKEFKYAGRPWSSTLLLLWFVDYYILIPDISSEGLKKKMHNIIKAARHITIK